MPTKETPMKPAQPAPKPDYHAARGMRALATGGRKRQIAGQA